MKTLRTAAPFLILTGLAAGLLFPLLTHPGTPDEPPDTSMDPGNPVPDLLAALITLAGVACLVGVACMTVLLLTSPAGILRPPARDTRTRSPRTLTTTQVRKPPDHAGTAVLAAQVWSEAVQAYTELLTAYSEYWTGPDALAEQVLHRPLIADGIAASDPDVLAVEALVAEARDFCTNTPEIPAHPTTDLAAAQKVRAAATDALGAWHDLYLAAGEQGVYGPLSLKDRRDLDRVRLLLDAAQDPANGKGTSVALDRAQSLLNRVRQAHGGQAVDLRDTVRAAHVYAERFELPPASRSQVHALLPGT